MKIRSRFSGLLLVIIFLAQSSAGGPALAQTGELVPKGTTYNYAQAAAWIDANQFVVARWDGTISIFRPPDPSAEFGPVLLQVLMLPSGRPAEMAAAVSDKVFVTSNTAGSLAIWAKGPRRYALAGTAGYDAKYGVANSAAVVRAAGRQWLVTGHSEGYVAFWEVSGSRLAFGRAVSVRSPDPIPSPSRLWNVRSVVAWRDGLVITGSEDGDICMVSAPDGGILTRMRYNPTARRGINSLSVHGDYLALGNCSVGPADKNLWLYRLQRNRIVLIDSANLIKDASLPQVFNFSVQVAPKDGRLYYFASTQEGLLWVGHVANDKLVSLTNAKISCEGGAAMAFRPEPWLLSVAAFNVHLFTVSDASRQGGRAGR